MNWPFPDVVQSYTSRDTILYALGLGYGADPTSRDDLPYVYEKGLVAAPTYPVVLGNPGAWMTDPKTGIDWVKSLHGEQGLKIFAPFPPQGTVVGKNRVDTNVEPMMGAEDFSFMLESRPGAFIFVGNGDTAGLHHPAYDFNDELIPVGTSYWVKLVETALRA
jgi:metal-dependent amidase/aminoacylase/carboxypeptidase family protein